MELKSNRTLCEWAGEVSHKDLHELQQFISDQTIVSIEPVGAIIPLKHLLDAIEFQIALEQGVE